MEEGVRWTAASELLAVDAEQAASERAFVKALPIALGAVALFGNAYFERFLREDIQGHYLTLFLLLHIALFLVIASANYLSRTEEIIKKSGIFPVSGFERFIVVVLSTLRQPAVLVLWSVNILTFAVFYKHDWRTAAVAAAALTFLLLTAEACAALVFLMCTRHEQPVAGIVLIGIVASSLFFGGLAVLRATSLLTSIPLVESAVEAVLSAQSQDLPRAILRLLPFPVLLGVTVAASRRFA